MPGSQMTLKGQNKTDTPYENSVPPSSLPSWEDTLNDGNKPYCLHKGL